MAIFITLKFARILGDASDGDVPADLVLGFITLYSPVLASLVLPISLFLGVMLAHGRMYVDSEMTVLKACGVSEWYVTRVTLLFAVIMAIVTAVVTLYLAPAAAEKEYQLQEQATANPEQRPHLMQGGDTGGYLHRRWPTSPSRSVRRL